MPDTPLPAPPRPAGASRLAPTEEDRERAAALLSSAFADDTLTLDQFEERVAAVYHVASVAELNALTADLPSRQAPAAPAAPARSRAGRAPAGAAPVQRALGDSVPAHDRRFAILANLEHHSMAV